MKKVVTFGEIMLRLGAPDYLRLTQCHQLDMTYAGAEANVAVSLSNYGIAVDYITRLPDNPIADKCIMELLSHRVGIDHVVIQAVQGAVALICVLMLVIALACGNFIVTVRTKHYSSLQR